MGDLFEWTVERVELLKQLHAQGLVFTAIGCSLGCSRNAAIGKAKRLGLHREQGVHPHRDVMRARARAKQRRAEARAAQPQKPKPARKTNFAVASPGGMPRPGLSAEQIAEYAMVLPAADRCPTSILDVRLGQCRTVLDERDPDHGLAMMCGAPAVIGTSWCVSCIHRYGRFGAA